MKKYVIIKAGLMLAVLLSAGCEKLITGMGPQPSEIDKTEYEARLNVLGVLRPDTLQGLPASFVHVEKTLNWDVEDSTEVEDVDVTLTDSASGESISMVYSNFGGTFDDSYYRHAGFFPEAGKTYTLSCRKTGFPDVTGTATVPAVPVIREGSWQVTDRALDFVIERDEGAAVYDLVFEAAGYQYQERVRRPETGDLHVHFDLPAPVGVRVKLTIFAYDLNLSEYISYNVSIKPNTFIAEYSTVEGGFGCFGALNLLARTFTH